METRASYRRWLPRACVAVLCIGHGVAIALGMGGWSGVRGPWPVLLADHGMHFHDAVATRSFLASTGTTAGYDPSFMAGYSLSVVPDPSATLANLTVFLFGGSNPARAYNLYVFACAALLPWLVAWAGAVWGGDARAVALAVAVFLTYLWTDFPVNYFVFGMLSFLLAIPIGLLTAAALSAYLDRGGLGRWAASALGATVVFMVHPTSCLLVAPADALAYLVTVVGARRSGVRLPRARHAGFWLLPVPILAGNAFWLVPGLRLLATKGESGYTFFHPEPVLERLAAIFTSEATIESALWGLGVLGLVVLARRDRIAAGGLGGFAAAGLFWGYLAGASRALDFLQPGRQTYGLYAALAVAAGFGLSEVVAALASSGRGRLDRWLMLGLLLIGVRVCGPSLVSSLDHLREPAPLLSSRPSARLRWMIDRVRLHVRPGERLLYEESGRGLAGIPDPFQGHCYSGVFPFMTGVELIGGPNLHIPIATNFTQFGEGKLFGKKDWDRAFFERYARLYRPAAILCWTPHARGFCKANPDLIQILGDDGRVLFGRVIGLGGAAIRGTAEVRALTGRLEVRRAVAGDDGLVVLRYHSAPRLRATPPLALESVRLEEDPVPFIAFRPPPGEGTFTITLSP